jgi:glycosyltransferase involved in cell wall biosynthesis
MPEKIIYTHPFLATFVKKDIAFLSEDYRLSVYEFSPKKKWQVPLLLIKQFFVLLFKTPSCKLLVTQFAGYHSFLPCLFGKIYGKPSLVILGGTDCVSFPSINYGNFNKKILAWFTEKSHKWATHLSPVDESLVYGPYTYHDNDYPYQGYKYFCPGIKTPHTTIYNGYDPQKFQRTKQPIPKTFVTIAIINKINYYRKGLDLIIEVARKFPDCTFTFVGNNPEMRYPDLPKNIVLVPFMPNEKLLDVYSSSTFYLQLSICEGFPNALCEAMLCGCIPIGSAVAAIPTIIGDTGFILKRKEISELESVINSAIKSDTEILSKKARKQIEQNFTEEIRKKELLQLVRKICVH